MNLRDWYELLGKVMMAYYLVRQTDSPGMSSFLHVEDRGDYELIFEGTVTQKPKQSEGA